jgi:ADP-ribosyl-[dinitrogen reductase] hydrolase
MAGDPHPSTAGNGSLMRLAPVVLAFAPDGESVQRYARMSSATTHAAPEAIDCCDVLASVLLQALLGAPKTELLPATPPHAATDGVRSIVDGAYRTKPRQRIKGSGYCVESLEAAMWCFDGKDSFEEAVLAATNLGDDADTTAAIVGQIAGAFYGVEAIPITWRERVFMSSEITRLVDALHSMSGIRARVG